MFVRTFIGLIFQAHLRSLQKEFLLTPYTVTLLFICKTCMRTVQIEFMLDFSYGITCKSCSIRLKKDEDYEGRKFEVVIFRYVFRVNEEFIISPTRGRVSIYFSPST